MLFGFEFGYTDGSTYFAENVTKVIAHGKSGDIELSGDAVLSTYIPLVTMSLYTQNGNTTVSGKNLRAIKICKECS